MSVVQFTSAKCFNCLFYKSEPQFIGDSGKCAKYPRNIPKAIYYQGASCAKFQSKTTVKKVVKKTSAKKK